MDAQLKQDTIKKYARNEADTGSSEVQVAVLTEDIKYLTEHLRANKRDHSTRRGLIAKVTKRRKLLDYMKRKDTSKYESIVTELKIRH